ncbi:homeobox protein orthopedia-like [Limulus polyphemus]|uniref:Homeobox protein orthopedia-like n=1 Tax=Limulus polyphemus TaxID=6850 RepID=A0ABM1T4Q8_LIMPO|nr:homeobox protein orthopedia-like [Limulus polyphemus]
MVPGQKFTNSSTVSIPVTVDALNHPNEFLTYLEPPEKSGHILKLKVGSPIMLVRNLDLPKLCNGTSLVVKTLLSHVIEATGHSKSEDVFIPRIPLLPNDYPFEFRRLQIPVTICFAMSINKAQGQSLKVAGFFLKQLCCSYGQFYVWFQNRRAKWKKRKRSTSVLRNPGVLLPSHSLTPLGFMSDGLCSFGSGPDTRWSMTTGMTPMGTPPLTLGPSTLSRQSCLGQSLSTSSMSGINQTGVPLNHGPATTSGCNVYQSHYGLNTLNSPAGVPHSHGFAQVAVGMSMAVASPQNSGSSTPPQLSAACTMSMGGLDQSVGNNEGEVWRETSITSLRRKAIEHSATMSVFR